MGREKYTNAQPTTVNGTINNSVTSLVVTDGSTFPTAFFRVLVESEIMFCTSRSSNTLTVVRGYEGTTAASHANGVAVNHIITAGALDRYRLGILSDVGIAPLDDSLSADDDEFDDENFSGWTFVGTTPSLVTTVEKNHKFSAVIPTGTASAQYYAWMKNKTPSAGDWVQAGFQIGGSGTGFVIPALFMANGSTYGSGKQVVWGYSPHENGLIIREMSGYNGHVGSSSYTSTINYPWMTVHLRMKWLSNDHYTIYCSHDGINWPIVQTNGNFGSIGAVPTWLGFGFTTWGASREFNVAVTYCRFSF